MITVGRRLLHRLRRRGPGDFVLHPVWCSDSRACVRFLVLAVLGCSHPQNSSNVPQVLRRGLSGEPATLDPVASGDTFSHEVLEDPLTGVAFGSSPGVRSVSTTARRWCFAIPIIVERARSGRRKRSALRRTIWRQIDTELSRLHEN
jgi:hypothetical protein